MNRVLLWVQGFFLWVASGLAALLPGRKLRPYISVRVEDLPDKMQRSRVYVAGEGEHVWAAAMLCPCGCDDRIELNLLPQVRPRWEIQEHDDGTVSLHPSVWRQKGCKSHFVLNHGRIRWC